MQRTRRATTLALAASLVGSTSLVAAGGGGVVSTVAPYPIDTITTETDQPFFGATVSGDGTTAVVVEPTGARYVVDIDAETTVAMPSGFTTLGADGDYYRIIEPRTVGRSDAETGDLTEFDIPLQAGWFVESVQTDSSGRYWLLSALNGGLGRVGAFVYDSVTRELVTPEPGLGTGMNVLAHSISEDGRYAVVADYLAGAQPAEYLRVDLQTDDAEVLFERPEEHDAFAGPYVLSPDFGHVLFPASQADVVPGLDATTRLYRRNLSTGATDAVPIDWDEIVGGSYRIADNGRVLFQQSWILAKTPNARQILTWDGEREPVMLSGGVDGKPADLGIDNLAEISDDGSRVTFTSFATNLATDAATGDRTLYQAVVGSLGSSLVPLAPKRLLETRSGPDEKTIDGEFEGGGIVEAGQEVALSVTGRGGVPDDADAVMLTVTAVLPTGPGYLTVYPCGATRPLASTVNYQAGQVVPNAVLAQVGTGGTVCIYTLTDTHIVADVTGYVPDGGSPATLTPARLLETRVGPNEKTIDGQFQGGGLVPAGRITELTVTGRGGVPGDADAVMLNVTAIDPSRPGYVTVWPCSGEAAMPIVSNLNYQTGQIVPNAVLAKIGIEGTVCIYPLADTHIVVDVTGYVADGGSPTGLVPARLLETRVDRPNSRPFRTYDGQFEGVGVVKAGEVFELPVTGRADVPGDAEAVMLNVTAIEPIAPGYLTVFPCGTTRPLASAVNYQAGDIVSNATLAEVGTDGKVCIYTLADTHIVVDVTAAW